MKSPCFMEGLLWFNLLQLPHLVRDQILKNDFDFTLHLL